MSGNSHHYELCRSGINALKPSGYSMYQQVEHEKFYPMLTECTYMFCIVFRKQILSTLVFITETVFSARYKVGLKINKGLFKGQTLTVLREGVPRLASSRERQLSRRQQHDTTSIDCHKYSLSQTDNT